MAFEIDSEIGGIKKMIDCPAGKVRCAHYDPSPERIAGICKAMNHVQRHDTIGWEQCPWPSKQKIVESKLEKLWFAFTGVSYDADTETKISKASLKSALKEAGYDD